MSDILKVGGHCFSDIYPLLNVAPSFFVSVTALLYVLSVVPKHGIVTERIFSLGMPSISKALAVTRSARVESSPPEIPTTALLGTGVGETFL